MYKIVYCVNDVNMDSIQFVDAKTYNDVERIVKKLIEDSSVLDIYVCRQVQHINAYVKRKLTLSSVYGMVVSK